MTDTVTATAALFGYLLKEIRDCDDTYMRGSFSSVKIIIRDLVQEVSRAERKRAGEIIRRKLHDYYEPPENVAAVHPSTTPTSRESSPAQPGEVFVH